jgi:hypothetical protein
MVNKPRLVAKPIKLNILRQNSLESNPMGAHLIMPNSNQLI